MPCAWAIRGAAVSTEQARAIAKEWRDWITFGVMLAGIAAGGIWTAATLSAQVTALAAQVAAIVKGQEAMTAKLDRIGDDVAATKTTTAEQRVVVAANRRDIDRHEDLLAQLLRWR